MKRSVLSVLFATIPLALLPASASADTWNQGRDDRCSADHFRTMSFQSGQRRTAR